MGQVAEAFDIVRLLMTEMLLWHTGVEQYSFGVSNLIQGGQLAGLEFTAEVA